MGVRLLVLCLLVLAACDDPLVIIGDRPGFMRITAGVADTGGVRLDSLAKRTLLSTPLGLAADSTGMLYIGDSRSRIFSVTPAGRIERIINHDPCFVTTCIRRPQSIAYSEAENALFIADDMNHRIWRVGLGNNTYGAVAGTGTAGHAPDGTPAHTAQLQTPTSVVVLSDGRIAFTEREGHRIRVIGVDGALRTLAGNGTAGEAADGAVASNASINFPTALAASGNTLLFTETGSHTVRALDLAAGTLVKIAGTGTPGFTGDNGLARDAQFNYPGAIAVHGQSLFVSDVTNDRVRVVSLATGIVTTFAGTGSRVFNGEGRNAGETALFRPTGLAISRFGFLYLADSGHHIIWRTPVTLQTR
jgi:sugar lactone lactonase YvrE